MPDADEYQFLNHVPIEKLLDPQFFLAATMSHNNDSNAADYSPTDVADCSRDAVAPSLTLSSSP
jgi:hypothetical protein